MRPPVVLALLLLAFISSGLWLSRHAWLMQPKAYQVSSQLLGLIGQPAISAKRAELLQIASHAKLKDHRSRYYHIHGQLFNPQSVPLALPTIHFRQFDRDNHLLLQQAYHSALWLSETDLDAKLNAIGPNSFVNFRLKVKAWPEQSWGYQIQLSD